MSVYILVVKCNGTACHNESNAHCNENETKARGFNTISTRKYTLLCIQFNMHDGKIITEITFFLFFLFCIFMVKPGRNMLFKQM